MKIGQHDFTFEEPDLIVLRVVGPALLEDAVAGAEAMRAFARGKSRVFGIADIRRGVGAMSGEARRAFLQHTRALPLAALAGIGGGIRDRVMMKLMTTAIKLLSRHELALESFDDERAARAWLEKQGCLACGAGGAKRAY